MDGAWSMLVTLAVSVALVILCFSLHLMVLKRLARLVHREERALRRPVLTVLFALFAAHLVEVLLYALALSALDTAGIGRLAGAVIGGPGWFVDHFYFSIASYTTLGIGDIVPVGDIRIIAGIEALNGLVLIAWSASFAYLVMERLWWQAPPGSQES